MFLHMDLDSFFAAAHRAQDPNLENKPIAVGGRSNNEIFSKQRNKTKLINNNSGAFVTPVFKSDRKNDFKSRFVEKQGDKERVRGILVTSSYEARAYGIKTAMPIGEALRLCPQLIVIPSDYPLYHKLSYDINAFLELQIPKIEQFSIDEWFGDISGWVSDEDAYDFAKKLQEQIKQKFNLPISIGISKAKWIAKLATEDAKPNGVYKVDDIQAYIKDIPIKEFPGIGKGYIERLKGRGIQTLGDIKKHESLFHSWGKPGIQLFNRVNGIDNEGIASRPDRKSIGISRTFDPLEDKDELKRRVMILCRNIVYMVEQIKVNPTSYFLKINYEYQTKGKTTRNITRIFSEKLFKETILEMFEEIYRKNYKAIKISVSVSNFNEQAKKTFSMIDLENDTKQKKLTDNVQKLREKFGLDIIKNANEL